MSEFVELIRDRPTERGFMTFVVFRDEYGADVTVRESSADPLDRVWVFIEGGHLSENKGSAHLSVAQALSLRDALGRFIDLQTEKEAS